MTYKERIALEYPGKDIDKIVRAHCPHDYWVDAVGHEDCGKDLDSDYTDISPCDLCWNAEVGYSKPAGDTGTTNVINTPVIKDSGNRTQFASGAVRDMHEGKGRCDLMPLEVVAEWLKDDVFGCIAQFKIHGTTTFLYGALNYFLDTSGWSYYEALLEVAKHFEEGAKKYGENNWQKGIPVNCYIDSAIRHYLKWLRGDMDERHDRALVWNLMCCIWEVEYHQYSE